jgi:transcriptional regulator of aroF, aroG, tyrA and aromatic amino acid transport
LQDGCFRRVGSDEEVYLDVRVMCATQVDLSELCARGEFRQDLYHRLNVLSLHIPPLRECLDGLEPLVEHFLDQASRQIGCPLPRWRRRRWSACATTTGRAMCASWKTCCSRRCRCVRAGWSRLSIFACRTTACVSRLASSRWRAAWSRLSGGSKRPCWNSLYAEHPSSRLLGKRLGVSHTTIANKLRDYEVLKADK